MKVEETVERICGENWRNAPEDERDGALGVALVIAFMGGCRPSLDELSKHLELDAEDQRSAEVPYRRLLASGVFSIRYNARRDRSLNGWSNAHDGRTAWCHIAAVASGWVGGGYYIHR